MEEVRRRDERSLWESRSMNLSLLDLALTHLGSVANFVISQVPSFLLPPRAPAYAQLYIHDLQEQLARRHGRNANLNPVVMGIIQGILNQTHPYVKLYKQAFQIMREKPEEEHDTVAIRLHADRNQDLQRYNLPTANDEVAAIIPGDGSEECSDHRDIVLRLKGGGLVWKE